jgi:hypothetical protein
VRCCRSLDDEIASESDELVVRSTVAAMLEMSFDIHHVTIRTETDLCRDEDSLQASVLTNPPKSAIFFPHFGFVLAR